MPPCMTAIPEINGCYEIAEYMRELYCEDLERLEKELHTDTASEIGISHREKMLKITPGETDTIEERRFRVQIVEMVIDVLDEKNLRKLVKQIGGEESSITIDKANRHVSVKCSLTSAKMFSLMKKIVEEYIPVTFTSDFTLLYNSYEAFAGMTYEQLGQKTWEELRSEILA